MSKERWRHRRKNLMEKDPYCYWCRRRLVYFSGTNGRLPVNFATLDHLNSRVNKVLRTREIYPGKEVIVLACPPCNQRRAQIEQREHPWIMRWKSGLFPKHLVWIGKILRYIRGQKYCGPK